MKNYSYKLLKKDVNEHKIYIKKDIFGFLTLGIINAFMVFRGTLPILYVLQLLFVLYGILFVLKNHGRIGLNIYCRFYIFFGIWSMSSYIWAINKSMALNSIISIIQIITICIIMSFYINSLNRVNRILYFIALSSLVMLVYFIIKTPLTDWKDAIWGGYSASTSQGRFGRAIGHHPNSVGDLCSISALVWFYFYLLNKNKFNLIIMMIFSVMVLFSKSRISLLTLVFNILYLILIYRKRKKNKIYIIAIIIGALIILSWAIFNIPVLYELVGYRMEAMMGIINHSYMIDASTNTRINMIKYGFEMFKSNPILGVGIGNYAYYGYHIYGLFAEVYSHNNYIEMLSNIGIVGFISYYFIPVYTCIKLRKLVNILTGRERILCAFLFVIMISRLIGDFGRVSYLDEIVQIINMLCYSSIFAFIKMKSRDSENDKKNNEKNCMEYNYR